MKRRQFLKAFLASVVAGVVGRSQPETVENPYYNKLRNSKCVSSLEVRERCQGVGFAEVDKAPLHLQGVDAYAVVYDDHYVVECPNPYGYNFMKVGEIQG